MSGSQMHDGDAEARSEAARALGSARTPAKIAAARAAADARRGKPLSEQHRAKISKKNSERWEKIRADRGETAEPKEKRAPGRPKKQVEATEAVEKRPRGRPAKQAEATAEATDPPKRPRGRPKKTVAATTAPPEAAGDQG